MANIFGRYWPVIKAIRQQIISSVMCILLVVGLLSCSQQPNAGKPGDGARAIGLGGAKIEEVSPPEVIQQLRLALDRYHPQVKILGPKPNETIESTSVTVRFQVENFPIYKDPEFALGPHLHVFLDDQSYQAIYDAKQTLTFADLSPGTHTIRAFASRPWHESFKTPGAFDQITFNVFSSTQTLQPDPTQSLLTYSRPQGDYGAEPIMLDYLITSPSNSSNTKMTPKPEATESKVRVSLNGDSFITNTQMPIYLKGFKPGTNWVKLELLNSAGERVSNVFSETIRLVTLNPNGQDTLSKLVRGELTAQEAERIVDFDLSQKLATQKPQPKPVIQPSPKIEAIPIPVVPVMPSPKASVVPSPIPSIVPSPKSSPIPSPIIKVRPQPSPSLRGSPSPKESTTLKPQTPMVREKATPSLTPSPQTTPSIPPTRMTELKSSPSPVPTISPRPASNPTLNQVDERVGALKNWFGQAQKNVLDQLKNDRAPVQPTKAGPEEIPLARPIQRLGSPSPQPEPKKALLSNPKQLESVQTAKVEVKARPDSAPPEGEVIPSRPTQPAQPTVDWQKFLQLPQGNIGKALMVKPTEQPNVPNRYRQNVESANLSVNETDFSK